MSNNKAQGIVLARSNNCAPSIVLYEADSSPESFNRGPRSSRAMRLPLLQQQRSLQNRQRNSIGGGGGKVSARERSHSLSMSGADTSGDEEDDSNEGQYRWVVDSRNQEGKRCMKWINAEHLLGYIYFQIGCIHLSNPEEPKSNTCWLTFFSKQTQSWILNIPSMNRRRLSGRKIEQFKVQLQLCHGSDCRSWR